MLLADYSLDLSAAGGRCLAAGVTRYERAAIEQVIPRPGRYPVSCLAGGEQRPAELVVRADSIELAADAREKVTAVAFR